jgi:hypothetical protein
MSWITHPFRVLRISPLALQVKCHKLSVEATIFGRFPQLLLEIPEKLYQN